MITIDNFPPIPRNVLEALQEVFPMRETTRLDTFEDLRWRGGQRDVVSFLERAYAEQQTNPFR